MIAKSELVHGFYYLGYCRNARIARWNAERNVFIYRRNIAGNTILEEINHPEDTNEHDVFVPELLCDAPTKSIPLDL
jgi:hypothetical protein